MHRSSGFVDLARPREEDLSANETRTFVVFYRGLLQWTP